MEKNASVKTEVANRLGGSKLGSPIMVQVNNRSEGSKQGCNEEKFAESPSKADQQRSVESNKVSVTCTSDAKASGRSPSGECGLPDFDRATAWRSEVHFDRCPVFGTSMLRGALVVPGWARERAGKVMDVLAGSLPRFGECLCHEMVLRHSTSRGEIILSPQAVAQGIKTRSAFFVHSLLSAADEADSGVDVHWEWGQRTPIGLWSGWRKRKNPRSTSFGLRRNVGVQVELGRPELVTVRDKLSKLAITRATTKRLGTGATPSAPPLPSGVGGTNASSSSGGRSKRARKRRQGAMTRDSLYPSLRAHFGDHSIIGNGAAVLNRKMAAGAAQQNILSWMRNRVAYDTSVIFETPDHMQLGVQSNILANAPYGPPRTHLASGGFDLWNAAVGSDVSVSVIGGNSVGHLDATLLAGFLKDINNYDTRGLASALTAVIGVDNNTCMTLAQQVGLSRSIMDNTSLYAKGWTLMHLRQVIIRARGELLNPPWLEPGADYVARSFVDAGIGALFESDVRNRRFIILASDFSAEQLNCIKHLARSGRACNNLEINVHPTLNRILWFGVPISVYYRGEVPPAANIQNFDPEQMRATLLQLAGTRGEEQQMALGFMKSVPLLCAKQIPNSARTHSWYMCTLEPYTRIRWPMPSDSNPIWRWVKAMTPTTESYVPADEILALQQGSSSSLLETAICSGALLSLGVSLAFNAQNINGIFLNSAANPVLATAGQIKAFASRLFRSDPTTGVPAIISIACAEIMHVTSIAIQPQSFKQDGWGCNLTQMPAVTDANWWRGGWGFRVPYLLDAYCCSWALETWPYAFGVFQSHVTLDIKADCIVNGNVAGWYASRGCATYKAITVSGRGSSPWCYENYGLAVLNALCQELQRNAPPVIQFQRWSRGFDAATVGPQVGQADGYNWPVDFIPALHTIRPGVIRNYDWMEDHALSPLTPRMSWFAPEWAVIRLNSFSTLTSVGLLSDKIDSVMGDALGEFDALGLYGGAEDVAAVPPPAEN
ncbi:MAG: putative capsid protein [Hattula totivirus 3]|nr:MAG: putative capsid protein [Hattula totivirus 3]